MRIIKSLTKHLLALVVVAGAWSCSSTNNLQHANYEDDDVYFSRKDREQAKIAKETEFKNNPTFAKTTTNTNTNGVEVNPTYGVNTTKTNDQTNVNPEYIENYRQGNSTITHNSDTYTGNEYYTEYRANNSRVQVPRDSFDGWGNSNNGVFYDPCLDPASPLYNPYASSAFVPFSVRIGWGNNWRYRRFYNRYRWYNPYNRNDYWYNRNIWWYGGYSNNNAWCPPNYNNNVVYTNTRPRIINCNPRGLNSGRRGSIIITNNGNRTKRQAQRSISNLGRDVNKRAATAGRRYKRTTTNRTNKRVRSNSNRTINNRTKINMRPRTTRTRTRTRRSINYSRPNYNRQRSNSNRNYNRSGSSYQRRSSRSSGFSRPSTTRRTRSVSRPSRSSSGTKRRKR